MSMRSTRTLGQSLMLTAFGVALVMLSTAHGADIQRGRLLYENHCVECHDDRAHYRNNRRANSLGEVHQWVIRWSTHLKLDWSGDERNDVAEYLYQRYYTPAQ